MHENLCVVLNNDSCFDYYKAQPGVSYRLKISCQSILGGLLQQWVHLSVNSK